MAPALVELSTSKERNSNNKKYIENLRCMSHLNLELVEKIGLDSSTLFMQGKDTGDRLQKENSSSKEVMLGKTIKDPINPSSNESSNPDFENSKNKLSSSANMCDSSELNGYLEQESLCPKLNKCSNWKLNETSVKRPEQPLATYTPSSNIFDILASKESSVSSKFSDIKDRLNSINYRLTKFHCKDISSHVACFVAKSDELLQSQQTTFKETADIKRNYNSHNQLKVSYDLLDCAGSTTDIEDDLDLKQQIPIRGKRQKCLRLENCILFNAIHSYLL